VKLIVDLSERFSSFLIMSKYFVVNQLERVFRVLKSYKLIDVIKLSINDKLLSNMCIKS
jgi:hypothetical protein